MIICVEKKVREIVLEIFQENLKIMGGKKTPFKETNVSDIFINPKFTLMDSFPGSPI